MHRWKSQPDGCNAGHRARNHRDDAEKKRGHRPVNEPQQSEHHQRTDQRQTRRLVLDGLARLNRKHARPRKLEASQRSTWRELALCLREALRNCRMRGLLCVEIRSGCIHLQQQQRAVLGHIHPHTTGLRRLIGWHDALNHRQHLAGGVACQQRFAEEPGRARHLFYRARHGGA